MSDREEHAIEKLRAMVRYFNNTSETLNQSFTSIRELERIYDAYLESGWDYTPDRWTPAMLKAALKGKPIEPLMPESMKT